MAGSGLTVCGIRINPLVSKQALSQGEVATLVSNLSSLPLKTLRTSQSTI